MVEWSRALDVRLSEWCCSVSMVWIQIPSREEIFRRIYIYIYTWTPHYTDIIENMSTNIPMFKKSLKIPKVVFRIHKSKKDRQHNGQKKKGKRTTATKRSSKHYILIMLECIRPMMSLVVGISCYFNGTHTFSSRTIPCFNF